MKVLFIDTELTWRGGENQMKLLIDGLQKFGVKCFLSVPLESEAYRRLNSVVHAVPLAMHGLKAINAAFKLAAFCADADINIIDAQSSKAHNIGLLVKMIYPAVKLVVHRRVDYVPSGNPLNRIKYLTSKVDQYVAISAAIGRVLVDYGVSKHRIAVVHSAVNVNEHSQLTKSEAKAMICRELNLDPSRELISCVAYLTSQKGHHTLLRGLAVAKEAGYRFYCLLAGDGPLRDELQQLATRLNISDEVRFLGVRSDAPLILKSSDIFAMSSNYEGLGTTILDALLADCPVVATDVGGIPEMIIHNTTGLLSPPGDGVLFGQNLMALLAAPDLRNKLAGQGKAFIKQHFHVDTMVDGNLKVYKSLFVS